MNLFQKTYRYVRRVYLNFKYLPLDLARHLPIDIDPSVKIIGLRKGQIRIEPKDGRIYKSMIQIGCSKSPNLHPLKGCISVSYTGRATFRGRAWFNEGVSLQIDGGQLIVGDKFHANANCYIRAAKRVEIGDEVLLGWNVEINDCDGHPVTVDGIAHDYMGNVKIGNHVWIAAHVSILKNTIIGNGSIVAQHALVNKAFAADNMLIGGMPAKIIKQNVSWNYD